MASLAALFAVALLSLIASGCTTSEPEPLSVVAVERCDDFRDGEGCRRSHSERQRYESDVPGHKQGSWYDFGYHLYFHSRETPGILVEWNRSLSDEERSELAGAIECHYRLRHGDREVSGQLEGVRISADGRSFWCFDYFGAMLIAFHRAHGSIEQVPASDFFPVRLTLSYTIVSFSLQGEADSTIWVDWSEKP